MDAWMWQKHLYDISKKGCATLSLSPLLDRRFAVFEAFFWHSFPPFFTEPTRCLTGKKGIQSIFRYLGQQMRWVLFGDHKFCCRSHRFFAMAHFPPIKPFFLIEAPYVLKSNKFCNQGFKQTRWRYLVQHWQDSHFVHFDSLPSLVCFLNRRVKEGGR